MSKRVMSAGSHRAGILPALLALAFLAVSCSGDGHGPSPAPSPSASAASIFKQNRLVIGVKNDQPGTSVWSEYKRTGFDILVARRAAGAEGLAVNKIAFNDLSSDDRVPALKDGRVDLVVATFSITDERQRDIDFVGPYAVTRQGFMVRKGSPAVRSVDDLAGKPVCAWTGTTSLDVLRNQYPKIHTQELADAQSCISALRTGSVFAVSTDQLILHGFAHLDPSLVVVPDVTVGAPNRYGIGIGKAHRADCLDLAKKFAEYVGSSDWVEDFKQSFPDLTAGDAWTAFQPKPQQVTAMSCSDASAAK
ncbi:transporter substrate-binding domain-containing protein [Kitasatospora sp. NPDC002227]|uniref:transporter substrate-binding domain-containing protein n=1 Tax=Kitasatospora sp. NPDC002227 TaxID=3154773 RepID=UPI003322C557